MKRAAVILIVILVLSMVVGCQTASNKPLTPDQNQTDNLQSTANDNQAMVNRFENLAEQVPGVDQAYVAISNSNAKNPGIGTINTNPGTNAPRTNTNMGTNAPRTNIDTNMGTNAPRTNPTTDNVNNRATQPLGNQGDRFNNNSTTSNNINRTNDNNIVVMVGLKLDNPDDTATMTDIENRVESSIKNADNRVSQVLITTDAGMIQQINDVNKDIKNGTPIESIQRSINNLTRNLTTNR